MYKLTKADLEKLATSQSYSRGASYYRQGEVTKVIQKGDTFEGEVSGMNTYNVIINTNEKGITTASCTCPYDWGGICKHIVAVGLAIVHGDFKKDESHISEADFFDQVYPELKEQQKSDFLRILLGKDANSRAEIMRFAGIRWGKNGIKRNNYVNLTDNNVPIDAIAEQLRDELADFIKQECVNRKATAQTSAGIEAIIKKNYDIYSPHLNNLHFVTGFKAMIALYEGCHMLEDLLLSETSLAEFLQSLYGSLRTLWDGDLAEQILIAPKTEAEVYQAIDALIERIVQQEAINAFYRLSTWVKVLEALIYNTQTANYLLHQLRHHKLDDIYIASLLLWLAEINDDEVYWLHIAEQAANSNAEIGIKLFNKYLSLRQEADYLRIARLLFDKQPAQTAHQLLPHLLPEKDKDLFLRIATYLVAQREDIIGYQQLSQIMTEKERKQFIAEQRQRKNFYARLMSLEGKD